MMANRLRTLASLSTILVMGLLGLGLGLADEQVGAQGSAADLNLAPSTEEEPPYVPKSKEQLRKELTALQFRVTQSEATEPAFRNAYWNNKKPGKYHCIVCDRVLFTHETKFDSGTGWPSFWQPVEDKVVGTKEDRSWFSTRIEVHCARCQAHLGHVFDDGPAPTGKRYCMNSASMKFVPADEGKSLAK